MHKKVSTQKETFVVQASSAGYEGGNFAKIAIDGSALAFPNNASGHDRGLHVALINQATGTVLHTQIFDTYKTSTNFSKFIMTHEIPLGCIVAAACKDECVSKLTLKSKKWFSTMLGSKEIWRLGYRQGFAIIGIFGQKQVLEKRSEDLKGPVSVT